ncbi:helix-turn-helix domain-containing protein [Aureivirga sp. CE67]|uniref:helix-turn-helix domain-containing protein n=1 Tax=Aureivirga sp. CE67 TaxID=1788983 RepID=UPI0018CA19CA|nr:AraC family transcriptional regulator [Aureivirga sp. CE67]
MIESNFYKPVSFLSKYIDRFYIVEKTMDSPFELPLIFPGTGLELLFHLNESLTFKGEKLSKIHTVCPRKIFNFDKTKTLNFVSIRFKSGAFRHFTSVDFSDLNDHFLSAMDLWGKDGEELLEQLKNKTEKGEIIKIFEQFLIEVFEKNHQVKNDKWDEIIDDLYYNFNKHSIKDFAEKYSLSLRQFERNFKKQFGLTAKEFQKIARFQYVTKQILFSKKSDYLFTILDNGYFDQSHFIKEFKTLTTKTPKEYFKDTNFENHLYFES